MHGQFSDEPTMRSSDSRELADVSADRGAQVQSFPASNAQVAAMSSYCVRGGVTGKTDREKPAGVLSSGRRGEAPISSCSVLLRADRLQCAMAKLRANCLVAPIASL